VYDKGIPALQGTSSTQGLGLSVRRPVIHATLTLA
jgi:hypothetical protein